MAFDDLFLPLLLPPPLPDDDTGDTGGTGDTAGDPDSEEPVNRYAGYQDAYAVHEIGDGRFEIEARDAIGLPETLTVVTPQPCTLTFAPTGVEALPDGSPTTVDTIVLSAYPDNLNAYRLSLPGRPQPAYWALTGISQASFETQLQTWSDAASQAQLDAAWPDGSPATPEEGRANFFTQVLAGNFDVPLEAGVAIGDLDPAALRLGLQIYDLGPEPIHPGIVLPDFDDVNGDLTWHPLIEAFEGLDIDVQIFLRFQYLKVDNSPTATVKAAFAPLVGATVEAVNALPGNVMDSGVTDADGRIAFFVSDWDWAWGGTADMFFRVTVAPADAIVRQRGRRARWDGTWATRDAGVAEPFEPRILAGSVLALDGSPGYYENYSGWTLGSASKPVQFNLGTPVLLRAEYETAGSAATVAPWRPVARGTEIQLGLPDYAGPAPTPATMHVTDTFYADKDGEVWGTSFDVDYGNELEIRLPLAIAEDSVADFVDSIELPRVATRLNPLAWHGREQDPNNLHWATFGSPAIGDPVGPLQVRVPLHPSEDVGAMLYALKCVRDTHLWWRTLTAGAWSGVTGAWVFLNDTAITAVIDFLASIIGQSIPSNNPPSLGVFLRPNDKWNRNTICHETSHGVMWSQTTIGLEDFACALAWRDYQNHNKMEELSEFAALGEGWSDLAATALSGGTWLPATPPRTVTAYHDGPVPLVTPIGLRIEGCFAGAYWEWMRTELGVEPCIDSDEPVLQRQGPTGPVPNDTLAPASADFVAALWGPLTHLPDGWTTYGGTSDLLALVEPSLGPAKWATLDGYLQRWGLT